MCVSLHLIGSSTAPVHRPLPSSIGDNRLGRGKGTKRRRRRRVPQTDMMILNSDNIMEMGERRLNGTENRIAYSSLLIPASLMQLVLTVQGDPLLLGQ